MSVHTLRVKPLTDINVSAVLLPLAGADCVDRLALLVDGVTISVVHRETGRILGHLPARHPLVAAGSDLKLVSASVDGDSYRAMRAHLTIGVEVVQSIQSAGAHPEVTSEETR